MLTERSTFLLFNWVKLSHDEMRCKHKLADKGCFHFGVSCYFVRLTQE